MTADNGINFRDATYKGQLIFSSAKIGQVEAWYPSWPGGYRDEIGFSASVPPFGDTQVEDLGDSFEVRQLFTEFTNWPNCICCYRYEEIIRFYEDGRIEFRFVSHGPGCDDLSIYRPFWRIDVDLDGPDNDSVWLWEEASWNEASTEFETYPVVEDLSPDGYKLATFDDDIHYRWFMERTDPLGLDEGYLFLLQFNENEGEGPITTGPGDTFIPPRQWIDGDSLSGENIVLWHVPLLNQKRGGPYWCMPDPEPAYSPCAAILHAQPGEELKQPTSEELATLEPTPEPALSPTPTSTPAPTATPRPLEGTAAEEILLSAGCSSCHQIGNIGEAHKVGPDLSGIGLLAGEVLQGMSLEEYIRQAIVDPNAVVATNCPNGPCLPNIMPRDYEMRLDSQQIETLVTYLLTLSHRKRSPHQRTLKDHCLSILLTLREQYKSYFSVSFFY
jgi:mono/diheme cytochrome c family protein